MKAIYFLVALIFVANTADTCLAQGCPAGKQYPYIFCIDGKSEIRCSDCPTNSQGTPLAPGMPDCVEAENEAGITSLSDWATSTPCEGRLAIVWRFSNLDDDARDALANWAGICPSVPTSPCCWQVKTTTNAEEDIVPLTKNGNGPTSTPAASTFEFDDNTCKPTCTVYETFLNFSDDFLKPADITDEDADGTPCDFFVNATTWFDHEDEPDPRNTTDAIIYLNIEDVLTHELGHILGVPEEGNFPAACPLTGIMNGGNVNGGEIQNIGLPLDDDARCWFKQLYCPATCTDAVAIQQPAPTFDLGQPYPSPLSGNILNVPYSIGTAGALSLDLFDVLGKQVANPLDSKAAPGNFQYQFNCAGLASGTYYVRLCLDGYPLTRQIAITHDR